ncbi:MAG: PAS domain S-box protein [bacterium]
MTEEGKSRWWQAKRKVMPEDEESFRTLAQNLPGIVYRLYIRENNRMQFLNDMLQPMTGFKAEELSRGELCSIEPLILPEDRPKVVDTIRQAVIRNQPFEVEYRLRTKEGEIRHFIERGKPIYGADGKPLSIDGIIIDITARRKAEEKVRQYRQHLEQLVQQRTAQLAATGEQLQQQITGRQQAEREITLSRERLHHLLNSSPAVIYSCKPSGDFKTTFISDNMKLQTGYEPWEITEDTNFWADHIHPDDRQRALTDAHQVFETDHQALEYRFQHKDGSYRWIHDEMKLLRDRKGNPLEILGSMIDISDRKRAEDETRIAYTELNQIFNAAVDGMCITDNEFNVRRVNDTFCKLFGISRSEIEGKNCCQVLRCPFCDDTSRCPLTLIHSGQIKQYKGDLEIGCISGRKAFCDLTVEPLRNPDGELIGVIENFRDITERRQADELLRESEEKYSTLVEQSKDVVGIIDEGIIKFANRASAELTGYAVEELVGKPIFDFVVPELKEEAIQIYLSGLASGEFPPVFETKALCKGGIIKDVEVSASLIHYQGKAVAMVIIHDITEHKQREEELERLQKIESLGVLAGGIAHDFNNLLTAITGNLSLVQENARSGYGLFGIVEEIQKAAMQARSLTQQLLTFSRQGKPVRKPVRLPALIKDTAIFAVSGTRARCEFTLPEDLWPAEVDAGQITQVINNLVINGNQAMPEGGIIEIHAENIMVRGEDNLPLKEGRYVKISVKDHGVGIRKEHLRKIFDPYFTTKQKGSGLGLAITYSIVKKHEGHITVESRAGAGTTFHIYLPAVAGKVPAEEERPRRVMQSGEGRILFMDDQKLVRDMVGRMLTGLGYEVVLAKEGDEAVELYKRARETGRAFAAVILDLTIPGGMGGEEVIQRLHEIDPGVKAIVSSGYADDPVMAEYQEHGFRGVVAKPYEIKELSETLSRIIQEGEKPY